MMRIENPKEPSTLRVLARRNDEANQRASLSSLITRIYRIVFYKDTSDLWSIFLEPKLSKLTKPILCIEMTGTGNRRALLADC